MRELSLPAARDLIGSIPSGCLAGRAVGRDPRRMRRGDEHRLGGASADTGKGEGGG